MSRTPWEDLIQTENIDDMEYARRLENMQKDATFFCNAPEDFASTDPRTGYRILYSRARKHRQYDYNYDIPACIEKGNPCPICLGKTTRIWDIAPLREGYTFINENLFPIIFPFANSTWSMPEQEIHFKPYGTHLLQWHSTDHSKDFHTMDADDIRVGMSRLAVMEKYLLCSPSPALQNESGFYGHVWISKNVGRLVGSSLKHGHLQIVHSSILPAGILRDKRLRQQTGKGFSQIIQEENNKELTIHTYGDGKVLLVTPFCMKRVLEAVICFSDTQKNYLHQLSGQEIEGLAQALHEVTAGAYRLMAHFHREFAYNLVFHMGEIGGLYIEMLPFTGEMGGYEHMGIYTCHATPAQSSALYRNTLCL